LFATVYFNCKAKECIIILIPLNVDVLYYWKRKKEGAP